MVSDLTRSVPFEVTRAEDNGDGLTLEGYAAVFNTPTRIDSWEGTFDESIKRGAFRKTIQERTPVLQFDHGAHPLIGSIPIGTISPGGLREDAKGLHVSARLSDNWLIQPIRDAIASGAVDGMSFRFQVMREEWRDGNGNLLTDANEIMSRLYNPDPDEAPLQRTLIEVRMAELGPVVFPAYAETSVGVRARSVATNLATNDLTRRALRESLVISRDVPTVEDPALRAEVARAILFDAPVSDVEPTDAPVNDHPSDEIRNDAPLSDEHPSDASTNYDRNLKAAVRTSRDALKERLANAQKGASRYER